MVVLCCAVVGEDRVIIVEIGPQQVVGVLKALIKNRAGYDFPSDKLALYLAKKNGNAKGEWMKDDDNDLVQLLEATIPDDIEKKYLKRELLLKPTRSMEDCFNVRDMNFPKKDAIHVLVDTRGKDHGSVAAANVNSPSATGREEISRRTAVARWLPVLSCIYYLISLVVFTVVLCYGESPGDKEKCVKDGVPRCLVCLY